VTSTLSQASEAMDLEDAAVTRKEHEASDRELVAKLVDQARAEGLELVGENGLLGRLTKLVLESALEGEITDHLGYEARSGRSRERQHPQRHPHQDGHHRRGTGGDHRAAGPRRELRAEDRP
jgi:hypothetical protein